MALSVFFLFVGCGLVLGGFETTDTVVMAVGFGCILLFMVSGWGSRLWSDQPVEGPRRFLAEAQFFAAAIVLAIGLGYLFVGLLLVIARLVSGAPELLVGFVFLAALLTFLMQRSNVIDLQSVRLRARHGLEHFLQEMLHSEGRLRGPRP
jgi:hypothetical protein